MNLFWCKVIETEDGHSRDMRLVVGAYNITYAKRKIDDYYTGAPCGMGVTYRVQAVYRLTFDVGDIVFLTGVMWE
jgi:hypothetical protein